MTSYGGIGDGSEPYGHRLKSRTVFIITELIIIVLGVQLTIKRTGQGEEYRKYDCSASTT